MKTIGVDLHKDSMTLVVLDAQAALQDRKGFLADWHGTPRGLRIETAEFTFRVMHAHQALDSVHDRKRGIGSDGMSTWAGSPTTATSRTTSHRCIDQSRQQKYRPRVGLEAAPEPSIAPRYGDPLLSGMLDRLIQALPDKPRIIVILRYQEEMEPLEIAAMLDIPVGTVKDPGSAA